MTKKEHKRLVQFIRRYEHNNRWYGWFTIHEPYAKKLNLSTHQKISSLLEDKTEVLKMPAKYIQSVSLYISESEEFNSAIYF